MVSAGSGFFVDLDALGGAASGITDVLAELGTRLVDDVGCDPGSLGHDRLADAVEDFCNCWRQGVNTLVQDSQQIADRLVQTADTYRQADADTHNALTIAASSQGG